MLCATLRRINQCALADRVSRILRLPGTGQLPNNHNSNDRRESQENDTKPNLPMSAVSRAIQRILGTAEAPTDDQQGGLCGNRLRRQPRWIGLPVALTHTWKQASVC